ncbi:MAG TPA: hypothetical protein V6C76_12940 [Drouetiella sp.]
MRHVDPAKEPTMRKSKRAKNGNMLVVVMVVGGVVLIALVVGMSFSGMYFAENILQNYANECAQSGAAVLNGGDQATLNQGINSANREGQMNDMIMRTRALVKESRENIDQTAQNINNENYRGLADQLMDEAKQSAVDMEAERKTLKQVSEQEATDAIINRLAEIQKLNVSLPWLQFSSPKLVRKIGIQFGQVKDVQSNVMQLDASNNLMTDDQSYVAPNKHYKAGANARLQGSDSSLDFKVSSLQPASLNKEISPARLILPDTFQPLKNPDDLSSAVRVTLTMNVATTIGAETHNKIRASGNATTTGASATRRDDSEFDTFER